MKKQITYREVEDLDADHPLMLEFLKQCDEMEGVALNPIEDEESLEYFNHYIAGDR
jgi:hypothetical protein